MRGGEGGDRPSKPRKPNLVDLMILVAATASGLALARITLPDVLSQYSPLRHTALHRAVFWPAYAAFGSCPILGGWSLALLVIRLRRPRPRLRALSRQPGFVAGVAGTFGIAAGMLIFFPDYLLKGTSSGWYYLAAYPIAYAVAASWAILLLGGRWRPERSWIDRLGRVVGVLWIGLIPLVALLLYDS